MTCLARFLSASLIALGVLLAAQPTQARAAYSQAELEQLLAPIALYPDALLAQVLEAATRPLEVAEAARWSRARPGLEGDAALRAATDQPWDPSVRSLVAFPRLLARMDEDLEWTKALGHAYFVQEPVVMETIQVLRQRARDAGQLAADDRLRIVDDGTNIAIETVSPQVIYLPYYDPWIVYGTWPWPAHPPVAWQPWPGYMTVTRPGWPVPYWWAPGVGVSVGLFFARIDWPHRRVHRPPPRPHAHPPAVHRPAPQFRAPPREHRAIERRDEAPRRAAPRNERPRQPLPAPQARGKPPAAAAPLRPHSPQAQPQWETRRAERARSERAAPAQREAPRNEPPRQPVPAAPASGKPPAADAPLRQHSPQAQPQWETRRAERVRNREAREERESPRRGVRP